MITFKQFFSFRGNRFFWINLLVMIAIVIGSFWGALTWLDLYTNHGKAIVVPNVKNKRISEAENILEGESLKGIVVDSIYVNGALAGTILDQKPQGGSKVKEGRSIYLTISALQIPELAIPDLIDNSSYRQAEAKLRALGFKVTEPEFITGEKGWVYGIKYKNRSLQMGESVPRESILTLCVGDGHKELANDSLEIKHSEQAEDVVVDKSWF
ncbi:MAG: PASTA domain-containing protein [Phocaeicola sp.]